MTTNRGIRTLRDLRNRCVIASRDDCWTFRLLRNTRRSKRTDPRVWLSEHQRSETLPRAAWLLAGRPLQPDQVVWRTCGSATCCNPAHLRAGTRADLGAWAAERGTWRGLPHRPAINRANVIRGGHVHLTMELAEWVRESHQTGVAVAHGLGVTVQCVSRVRLRQTWAPAVPAASVWAWAGAAAGRA
jgi:hypothetical protein